MTMTVATTMASTMTMATTMASSSMSPSPAVTASMSTPMATTNSSRLLWAGNRISHWLGVQVPCSAGRIGLTSSHTYLVRGTVAGGAAVPFLAMRASDRDTGVRATCLDPLDTSCVGATSNKLTWLVTAVIGAVAGGVPMLQVAPTGVMFPPLCFCNRKSNGQK